MVNVEIIICTHNRSGSLDACLTSLARQNAPKDCWSVLVIDNGSTDGTEAVLDRHDALGELPGLRRFHEDRRGLTAARRRGVGESSAPYIAFVDDDCHLAPDWIAQTHLALARHPDAVGLGGRVEPTWRPDLTADLRRHCWIFAEQPHGRDRPEGEIESLVGTGLVVDRNALVASGWYAEPLLEDRIGRGATSGGDVEICLRLRAAGGRLFYVPQMRLQHRIEPGRQNLRRMLELAEGLGTGSTYVSLMQTELRWTSFLEATARDSSKRQRDLLASLLRRHLSWTDWRIYHAFELGRRAGLARLSSNEGFRTRLAGSVPTLQANRSQHSGNWKGSKPVGKLDPDNLLV